MAINDTIAVLLICIGLLAATFFCAYAPSWINASPRVMNLIAIYGGGTIIGAAIVIVLPEAASILINAQHELDELNPDHDHDEHEHTMPDGSTHSHEGEVVSHEMAAMIGTAILIGFTMMLIIDESTAMLTDMKHQKEERSSLDDDNKELQPLISSSCPLSPQKESENVQNEKNERNINSAFLTTIALCVHSLTEGVAMGASLFCKYTTSIYNS